MNLFFEVTNKIIIASIHIQIIMMGLTNRNNIEKTHTYSENQILDIIAFQSPNLKRVFFLR